MIKYIVSILLSLALFSCGGGMIGGKYQENLKRLDKVHGYCDNPIRNIKKGSMRYKTCKDQENAAGADGIVDKEFSIPFEDILNRKSEGGQFALTYNRYLWDGSLDVLSKYPLKTVDSQGGYLETEYIYDENIINKRCTIKVKITSVEFLSNGVKTSIICQDKKNDQWYGDGIEYKEDSKQVTLAILQKGQILAQQNK